MGAPGDVSSVECEYLPGQQALVEVVRRTRMALMTRKPSAQQRW